MLSTVRVATFTNKPAVVLEVGVGVPLLGIKPSVIAKVLEPTLAENGVAAPVGVNSM
jgi:hypothetical protein